MNYQKPDEEYLDYTTEPCDWQMAPGVRTEVRPSRFLDYSAAIHEASHAALSEHFGYRVIAVEIQGMRGLTETERTKQSPEHAIIITHAGYVAAIQVVNKRHAFATACEDIGMIDLISQREKYTTKQLRELYQQCINLVEQNWVSVQALANVLADKTKLNGDEVRVIIGRGKNT